MLFHGPPGLGKTTLSRIVANELELISKKRVVQLLKNRQNLAGLLTSLEKRDVLFIDEIHRLSTVVEEYLYAAMEDYKIDIMIDTGPNARSIQKELNPFNISWGDYTFRFVDGSIIITLWHKVSFALLQIRIYLPKLFGAAAELLGVKITSDAAKEISRRSRGTPRIANGLLRRMRDFAQILGNGTIDMGIAEHGLKALKVDANGLDEMDNKILTTLVEKFKWRARRY